jgi:CRISPR-associated protein Cas5t
MPTLETRIEEAIREPDKVNRYGLLCLGLSDDAVNDVSLNPAIDGAWHRLLPDVAGSIELPVWVDHVGSATTRWQRYQFEREAKELTALPGDNDWRWTEIRLPQS